jgi:type I restriction enzyme M protein
LEHQVTRRFRTPHGTATWEERMTIQLANFVWGIADQIRGVYKPAQYGQVILPFAILRRMEAVMNGHRDEIRALAEKMPNEQALAAKFRRDFDLHFWNTSTWTLKTLLGDPENLAANLIDYVAKFSSNVADIFEQFGFEKTIAKLDENDRLFIVVDAFADVDLHPSVLSNTDMGQMFEHLIYKFSTASNETAGEHFTPRDAIRLMVDLLLDPDSDVLSVAGTVRTIYDPTAGTGGMLSVTEESIHDMNEHAQVALAGQELNPESYAMCKADMIGKGQDVGAIRRGDTLLKDLHEGTYFDYCLSNPPYGGDWRAAEAAVRAEHKRGFAGRFGAGLPRISDGQMLFLQHLVAKMRPAKLPGTRTLGAGRRSSSTAHRCSPVAPGQVSRMIRRWLIESDLIDAISRAANQHVLQHRHRDIHLAARQQQTRSSQGQDPAH